MSAIERALIDAGVVLIDEGAASPAGAGAGAKLAPKSSSPENDLFLARPAAGVSFFRDVPRPERVHGKRRGQAVLTAERRGTTRNAESMRAGLTA